MDIRNARVSDLDELIALWRIAFDDDSYDHVSWFFRERFLPERGLVLCENGRIASCLYLLPYRVKIRGVKHNAPFVVGAATVPQARGKGLMGTLLREAYKRLHEQGEALSMLYPFQYGFYRRMGYETVSAQLVYTLSRETLKELTRNPYAAQDRAQLRTAPLDDAALKAAYDAMMARFDTGMVRNSALSYERLDEWTSDHLPSMMCEREGNPCGYALHLRRKSQLVVYEIVYQDSSSLLFLLERLGEIMDKKGLSAIQFPLPVDEPIDYLLEDARGAAQYNPFAMLRALDVGRLLTGLPLRPAKPFTLRITDAHCPWNDGVYDVEPGERTRVARSGGSRFDAECSVNTLAQLAAGFIGGREAVTMGLFWGDEHAAEAFDRRKCHCFDMY